MSEIKHTPGPWLYRYGAIWAAGDGGPDTWDRADDEPLIRIGLADREEGRTRPVERDCNARLMAAAPELLAMLKVCEPFIPGRCRATRDAVRLVIASAEGE